MIGSSGPMIASTFWKKTIQGAISCDQPTLRDSSSCSRKLPAVWKNFLGMIGARRRTSASATRSPLLAAAGSRPRSNSDRMSGTSRTDDLVPFEHAGARCAVGRLEGHELHASTSQSSAAASA